MINLGNIFVPTLIDYKTTTGKITLRTPEYLSQEYIENSVCELTLTFTGSWVSIDYYCETDAFLSYLLDENNDCLSEGDLSLESFDKIQTRALKVLANYIEDAQQEMLEYFEQL